MLWNTDPNPSAWSRWLSCLNELFQRTSIALLEKDSLNTHHKTLSPSLISCQSRNHGCYKRRIAFATIATAPLPYYISQKISSFRLLEYQD
jgi:hypothetical protein